MSDLECAPIVFGRTYEVDFRFLVVPEDFCNSPQANIQITSQSWLEKHIDAAMCLAERLPGQPRWTIFRNKRGTHCIVGVACAAIDISEENAHDQQGRELYVFLGYVFRSSEIQLIPMQLDKFSGLYSDYVLSVWDEKIYSKNSKSPKISQYKDYKLSTSSINSNNQEFIQELNFKRERIYLWPNISEFRDKLWLAVSRTKLTSVCLGLPNDASALRSPFLNGTSMDHSAVKMLERGQLSKTRLSSRKVLERRQEISQDLSRNLTEAKQWNDAEKVLNHKSDLPAQRYSNSKPCADITKPSNHSGEQVREKKYIRARERRF